MSDDILKWSGVVEDFVKQYGKRMSPDKREDLRQDIYVALLEYKKPLNAGTVREVAGGVVDKSRSERIFEQQFFDRGDAGLDKTHIKVEASELVQRLPRDLRQVAVDLFFHELGQDEIAIRYQRSQQWVSKTKLRILNLMKKQLKRRA